MKKCSEGRYEDESETVENSGTGLMIKKPLKSCMASDDEPANLSERFCQKSVKYISLFL